MPSIQEYMKFSGLTYKQVRTRIEKGEIPARKVNGQYEIIDAITHPPATKADGTPDRRRTVGGMLKDELMEWQIKRIQQGLEDGKIQIREEFKQEIVGNVLELLSDLKEALLKCQLTTEQADLIKSALNSSLERLRQSYQG